MDEAQTAAPSSHQEENKWTDESDKGTKSRGREADKI